jgi:hypothetical protein
MARQRLKMRGFRRREEGFEAGKRMGWGRGRILENPYSFLVLAAYFGGGGVERGKLSELGKWGRMKDEL